MTRRFTTYYDTLRVPNTASDRAIRAAYRKLAQKYHPDKNPNALEQAHRNMLALNEAFQVLADPQRRASYDSRLAARQDELAREAQAAREAQDAARRAETERAEREQRQREFREREEVERAVAARKSRAEFEREERERAEASRRRREELERAEREMRAAAERARREREERQEARQREQERSSAQQRGSGRGDPEQDNRAKTSRFTQDRARFESNPYGATISSYRGSYDPFPRKLGRLVREISLMFRAIFLVIVSALRTLALFVVLMGFMTTLNLSILSALNLKPYYELQLQPLAIPFGIELFIAWLIREQGQTRKPITNFISAFLAGLRGEGGRKQ